MNNVLGNPEEILAHQIKGFHQYVLTAPVHLHYVSTNFCNMVEMGEDELLDKEKNLYLQLVHPADREDYSSFIQKLAKKEQTLSSEHRLVTKHGTVLWVRNTATSKRLDNGILVGTSVLTDITDIRDVNHDLRFLNETIPCGCLRYTCEQQPRITYIDQKMMEMMRFPVGKDGEPEDLELYRNNIFLMVPMEERRRFSKYLERVTSSNAPVAGEISLLRCDGTRAHILGWVIKCVNDLGEPEFQSTCIDITERYRTRKAVENQRYIDALADVFDKVFEFNMDAYTVRCLHCQEESYFKQFKNIAVQSEDAMGNWVLASVLPEYRDSVQQFFQAFYQKRLCGEDAKPPQITYQARSTNGEIKEYTGIFIKVDESVSLYCCRETKALEAAETLKLENDQLKEKMRDLVMQFSDGIAAFEVSPDRLVKPLYASENVCEFFGYSKEEWLPLTTCFTPLEQFVAHSEAVFEDFAELLSTGEKEFTYFDYKSECERRIRAICSEKEPNTNSSRFVMLYAVDGSVQDRKEGKRQHQPVMIRTFGYFDVFVGNHPIVFRNKKAKELLALLVDRKGGYVASEEAIGFLWEDEPVNALTLSRYRKVALRLKSTLEEYGISNIIEAVDGKRRIVMDQVECDLYQYLSGNEKYAQLFKGSYLTNYSWGETTLGEMMNHQK